MKPTSLSKYVLDVLLLLVGLIDTLLVCLYSYEWNTYTGSSNVEAIGFAVALTGASIVFFEYAVKYLITIKQSGRRHLVGPLVLFMLWAVIATYSMQNTTAAQYIGTEREKTAYMEAHKDEIAQSTLLSKLDSEMARIDESQKQAKTRIAEIDKTLATASTVEQSAQFRSTIATLRSERASLQTAIDKNESIRRKLLDQSLGAFEKSPQTSSGNGMATTTRDVFAFYRDVLGVRSSDTVQLTLAIFKGVVLDLINILCFMFVMLRRKDDINVQKERNIRSYDDARSVQPAEGIISDSRNDRTSAIPRVGQKTSPSQRLAAFIYEAKGQSSNGTLISARRAFQQLGINHDEYESIVKNGLLHGVLRQRSGKTFVVPGYSEDEFVKEVSNV